MGERPIPADAAGLARPEHEAVPRPRLNRRLADIVHSGVVVIHAGAGYGKTALLRDWTAGAGTEFDVVSIELTSPNEDEFAERLADELGLQSSDDQPLDLPAVVAALSRAARTRRRPAVLVVDESGIQHAGGLLRTLATSLAHRPPELTVIIAGREVDIADWRRVATDRQPVEIDERDLRFDDAEARQLLATLGVPDVSDDEIERMQRRVHGWAMGLSLAARARQIGHHVPSAVAAEHTRLVRRYLDNEVIPSLSADQLALLEATAPLRRLDPPLCDLILDRTDAAALLAELVERSCLVEPLSVDPPAFTVHPMFAEQLLARGRSAETDATSATRTRAIEWYEDVGLMDAAIELALEDPRPERAVALIKRVCGDRIRYGHSDLVAGWLQQLPSDVLWNDVELSIVMGRAAGLTGDPMTGRAVLRTIRELVGADEASDGLGLALAQLEFSVRFWEGRLGRLGRSIEERRAQFEYCQTDPVLEMAGIDSESLHVSLITGYVLDGELDRAITECEHLLRPERMLDPTRLTIMGLGMLALALAWRGDEPAAREAVRRAKRVCERYRGGGGDAGFLSVAALWVCDDGPRLDDDFRVVQRAAAGVFHLPGTAFAALAVAKFRLRLGAPVEAAHALDAADDVLAAMPEPGYLAVLRDTLRAELAEAAFDTIEPLNDRELEVLDAVARCESRSDAASELYLSVNTVKTHLRSAYRKLRVTDRDEAIRRATALGMLDQQPLNPPRRDMTAQASPT